MNIEEDIEANAYGSRLRTLTKLSQWDSEYSQLTKNGRGYNVLGGDNESVDV